MLSVGLVEELDKLVLPCAGDELELEFELKSTLSLFSGGLSQFAELLMIGSFLVTISDELASDTG